MYVHNLLLALYSAAVTIFMVRHAAFVRFFPAAPVCAKYCVVFVWLSLWFFCVIFVSFVGVLPGGGDHERGPLEPDRDGLQVRCDAMP